MERSVVYLYFTNTTSPNARKHVVQAVIYLDSAPLPVYFELIHHYFNTTPLGATPRFI